MKDQPLPTREEVRDWLDRVNRDRFWLGSVLGASKGTVDSWFSTRGFPKWALLHIATLIHSTKPGPELSAIEFSASEFENIETARVRACYLSRKEFYRDAILEKAESILSEDEDAAPPTPAPAPLPPLHALPRVAEEPTPYRTKRTDPDNLDDIRQQMDDDNHTN